MSIVLLYVDDMIYTGNLMLEEFRTFMKNEFEITGLALMKYFLGLEVTQIDRAIFICQHKYATDILQRFRMDKCKLEVGTKLTKNCDNPMVNNTLYKQITGSLMYLTSTRPDLMYVVSLISIFMESPKDSY